MCPGRVGVRVAAAAAANLRRKPRIFRKMSFQKKETEMSKLLATLVAGLFSAAVFAQATPATPATPAAPAKAEAKAEKKEEKKAAKAEKKAKKADKKDAKAEVKAEAKAEKKEEAKK
jgi:hypothetical protein